MYSGVILLPTLIVNWIINGITAANTVCGVLMFIVVTLIVLILSCALGKVVARVSLKLKNKSFITVLVSLLFIAGYYFIYFKAQEIIRDLVANAAVYGENIKKTAYPLYLFGRMGDGDFAAAAIFTAATAALLALTLFFLSRGFLKLASAGASAKKVRASRGKIKERSAFGAALSKEFARFTSSPNYMLNCGLGTLLIPAAGIFMLIKGRELTTMLNNYLAGMGSMTEIVLCALLMLMCTMNDMATPSVSLEGKSLWIVRSLPVDGKTVLRAKLCLQLILTGVPMIIASVCCAAGVDMPAANRILICLLAVIFTVFSALFDLTLGLRNPDLTWTSEIVPIKQSGAVLGSLFGSWGFVLVFAGAYFALSSLLGPAVYLAVWCAVFAAVSALLYRRIMTKGAEAFAKL